MRSGFFFIVRYPKVYQNNSRLANGHFLRYNGAHMNATQIRQVLEETGVSPSKSLGQNFLVDENIARWIVCVGSL